MAEIPKEQLDKWFPYDQFLKELKRTATAESLREFILLTHLYCEYYLNRIIEFMPALMILDRLSQNEEHYEFFVGKEKKDGNYGKGTNFPTKLHLFGIFADVKSDGDDENYKRIFTDLKELNTNRNEMAHSPFLKQIKIRDAPYDITDKNLEFIKNFYIERLRLLHTIIYTSVSGLQLKDETP